MQKVSLTLIAIDQRRSRAFPLSVMNEMVLLKANSFSAINGYDTGWVI